MRDRQLVAICFIVSILLGVYCLGYTGGRKDQKKHMHKIAISNSGNMRMAHSSKKSKKAFNILQSTGDIIGTFVVALKN